MADPLCPGGCGTTTEVVLVREGSGATVVTKPAVLWCQSCLTAKTRRVRAELEECHCSQIEGVHRHAS